MPGAGPAPYGGSSLLQLGDTTILSETGFHLLFSLLRHPVVKAIQKDVDDLRVNSWFLDDGTQVGTREQLQRLVDILQREGPALGSISPPPPLFKPTPTLHIQLSP